MRLEAIAHDVLPVAMFNFCPTSSSSEQINGEKYFVCVCASLLQYLRGSSIIGFVNNQ